MLCSTIGKFVRDMLTQAKWCDIYYPRIPIPIQKQITESLKEFDKEMGNEADQGKPLPSEHFLCKRCFVS